MSEEDSPNVNAMGLVIEMIQSVENNSRGMAKEIQIWNSEKLIRHVGELVESLRNKIDEIANE